MNEIKTFGEDGNEITIKGRKRVARWLLVGKVRRQAISHAIHTLLAGSICLISVRPEVESCSGHGHVNTYTFSLDGMEGKRQIMRMEFPERVSQAKSFIAFFRKAILEIKGRMATEEIQAEAEMIRAFNMAH